VPELSRGGFFELVDRVLVTGQAQHAHEYHLRLERTNAPAEGVFTFVLEPLRDAANAIEGVAVMGIEVTEHVRIRESAEWLAAGAFVACGFSPGVIDGRMPDTPGPPDAGTCAQASVQCADDNTLRDEFTLVDPVAFAKPWTVIKTYKRAPPDFKLMPYVCENNRNPVAADGSIGTIMQSGDAPKK